MPSAVDQDQWGDPIEDGDTVITLVDDPSVPGGVRPVLWTAGVDEPPQQSSSKSESRGGKLDGSFRFPELMKRRTP